MSKKKKLRLVPGKRVIYYSYIFHICTSLKIVAENGIGNDRKCKIMQKLKHTDLIMNVVFNERKREAYFCRS